MIDGMYSPRFFGDDGTSWLGVVIGYLTPSGSRIEDIWNLKSWNEP